MYFLEHEFIIAPVFSERKWLVEVFLEVLSVQASRAEGEQDRGDAFQTGGGGRLAKDPSTSPFVVALDAVRVSGLGKDAPAGLGRWASPLPLDSGLRRKDGGNAQVSIGGGREWHSVHAI